MRAGQETSSAAQEKALCLKRAARYLGLRPAAGPKQMPNPEMQALLEKAYGLLMEVAEPKHHLVPCGVRVLRAEPTGQGETDTVCFGELPPVQSRHLARLLAGCREGYGLLATLGMGLDLAVKRWMLMAPALGAALGACGSAYVDVYIDGVLRREEEQLGPQGRFLTPRFSPGYGDAPLSMQPGLLALCKAHALGVHLTKGNLMVPEKSVSAVMGITTSREEACRVQCKDCSKKDCQFREEEE